MKQQEQYREFKLETVIRDNGEMETVAFDSNGNPVAGTASHLDKQSSVEKMKLKLDQKFPK